MKLQQLSVFLENKPGALTEPCRLLAEAKVNLRTLALADTQQFGILRLIVQDPQSARTLLEKAGWVAKLTEVLAIEVPDRPGGLVDILTVVEHARVNVEYMYAFTARVGGQAVLVFRFSDPDAALRALQAARMNVLGPVELFESDAD